MKTIVPAENSFLSPPDFVRQIGGCYSGELGIRLANLDAAEIYQWFIAAVLYGARISEEIATRTWRSFHTHNVLTPEKMLATGWNGLVAILDEGGYVRYDYKTATKLLEVNRNLLSNYGGDLTRLHESAAGPVELEQRVMALGKGIGKVTADIFLRELRGLWPKSAPPASPLAILAASQLGYLHGDIGEDNQKALKQLQHLWKSNGMSPESFAEFESALVRKGVLLRRELARLGK